MPPRPTYMERLVEAYSDLLRRETRTRLTDVDLAGRVGALLGRDVASQVAGRWLAGKHRPGGDDEKMVFAAVLGVEPEWLYWNKGPKRLDPAALPDGELSHDVDAARAENQTKREAAKRAVVGDRGGRGRRPKPQ
jgi:hypothetical protein